MTLTLLGLLLALGAGVVSMFAPCVMPMLPVYLAYLTGEKQEAGTGRRLAGALGFVAGFAVVFVVAFYLLRLLVGPLRIAILAVFGVLVILMALKRLGWVDLGFLDHPLRVTGAPTRGPAAGVLLGGSLAFGWTPCMGPILAAVLGQAILQQQTATGLASVLAYVVGLGAPFVLLALFAARSKRWLQLVGGHRRALDVASSLILAVIGVLLITNNFAWLDRLTALALALGGPS